MKLTKSRLKQIIKEELQKVLLERPSPGAAMHAMAKEARALLPRASAARGRKAAQLETTLKTGDLRFLKQAYEQAKEFQRCEQGSNIEYSVEAIVNNIGLQID